MNWSLLIFAGFSVSASLYGVVRLLRDNKTQGNGSFFAAVKTTKDGDFLLLNLVLVNTSRTEAWVEECVFSLADYVGTPSKGCAVLCRAVVGIREIVYSGETLQFELSHQVYDAAGRPQDEYSFVIVGTVKYRFEDSERSQSFLPRRVKMRRFTPIESSSEKEPQLVKA